MHLVVTENAVFGDAEIKPSVHTTVVDIEIKQSINEHTHDFEAAKIIN